VTVTAARVTLTLTVIVATLVAVARAQWKTPWDYEGARGAAHWSELDPDYAPCNTGKEQSPIDIQRAEQESLPSLRFQYRSGPLKYLIDNGHTIRVNYHDAPGGGNLLNVGGDRYHLTQFHFHRPSEEHVHGKQYAMVVHLMHDSADGKSVGVAVLIKAGRPNATVQRIWEHMPRIVGSEQDIAGVDVNPADLLPADTAYYTYEGSLTAPPCTEHVTWFILKTPLELSAGQIKAFAKLYPHDVRPVQPLNGRTVKESR
jgi:carbonic anhydrase